MNEPFDEGFIVRYLLGDLPEDAGIPKVLGCRERAAQFVKHLST